MKPSLDETKDYIKSFFDPLIKKIDNELQILDKKIEKLDKIIFDEIQKKINQAIEQNTEAKFQKVQYLATILKDLSAIYQVLYTEKREYLKELQEIEKIQINKQIEQFYKQESGKELGLSQDKSEEIEKMKWILQKTEGFMRQSGQRQHEQEIINKFLEYLFQSETNQEAPQDQEKEFEIKFLNSQEQNKEFLTEKDITNQLQGDNNENE